MEDSEGLGKRGAGQINTMNPEDRTSSHHGKMGSRCPEDTCQAWDVGVKVGEKTQRKRGHAGGSSRVLRWQVGYSIQNKRLGPRL